MQDLYTYKSTGLKIKDVDTKKGIVSGYFSAFGMPDSDGDIIKKGAYAKTIKERGPQSSNPRIKHLLDHDTTKAIGVLLELAEDDYGLLYTSKLGTHTLGKDALLMYEEGIITEHSVGFKTVKENKDGDYNAISEIMLWEGSGLQAWGANQYTPVTGVKSLLKDNPTKVFDRLDKLTKALNKGFTDETIQLLEIEIEQIKQALTEALTEPIIQSLKPEPQPQTADLLNTLKSFNNSLFLK